MILVIVAVSVVIVASIISAIVWDWEDPLACICFLGFITLVLSAILVSGLTPRAEEYHEERQVELIAIDADQASSSSASGSFFLVLGHYSSESSTYPVYNYYQQAGDGGIKLVQERASNITIYEDSKRGGHILQKRRCHKPVEGTWYQWSSGGNCDNLWENHSFHVPPNTVQRDITLDLP